jgi:hypothetical protein
MNYSIPEHAICRIEDLFRRRFLLLILKHDSSYYHQNQNQKLSLFLSLFLFAFVHKNNNRINNEVFVVLFCVVCVVKN